MSDQNLPVLVGADQLIDRPRDLDAAMSPLDMMTATARGAAVDAGLDERVLSGLDRLFVIDSVGPTVRNPPAALAERLDARAAEPWSTATGGNTPQMLVNHSAREIATATPDNRYIGYPYTKLMNAVMDVNQSASLLLMSERLADRLGVDRSRRVYLHGCADANDVWHVSERASLHTSPALALALPKALDMANVTVADIDWFDIYSCFPAVVEITRDLLSLAPDDPRPLTVTGGLPYFGGPGNNYVSHAIATLMERLRKSRDAFGLVTGNGWYVTKHSIGIYSCRRPGRTPAWERPADLQARVDDAPHPRLDPAPDGPGHIVASTVLFDRSGAPHTGLVIGETHSGSRFVAHTLPRDDVFERLLGDDSIRLTGRVVAGDPLNRFDLES